MKNDAGEFTLEALLAQAVKDVASASPSSIVFGGYERGGITTVSAVEGNRTGNLHGLRVAAERGLGGRALVEARPRFTADYATSAHITHDYDGPILSEGITALVAVPVIVDGRVRAVLYSGSRHAPAASFLQTTTSIAGQLSNELRVHDEVERRVAVRLHAQTPVPGPLVEGLRRHQADLRGLRAEVTDPVLRQRLQDLERSLAGLGVPAEKRPIGPIGPAGGSADNGVRVPLSPRELDVLSLVALGSSNRSVGAQLGLTESTVKSYLKSIMSKLDATNRHEAVVLARRFGLLV